MGSLHPNVNEHDVSWSCCITSHS